MKFLLLPLMLAAASFFLPVEEEKLAIGHLSPEIQLQNEQGETVALSSLKGKVVLIDFWASWCKPCRYEMTHVLKPAYQQYKDKGFEIYSVSLDDRDGLWRKALDQEQVSWVNVSDLKGWRSPVAATYRVNKIPSTFLLDREGKLMAVDLRGKALIAYLEKIL